MSGSRQSAPDYPGARPSHGKQLEIFQHPYHTIGAHSVEGIFLRKEQSFRKVRMDEILLLKGSQNYTYIYTKKETYLYSKQLNQIAQRLIAPQFVRVHRSYIINIDAIDGFEGNQLLLGNTLVPISKPYREKVFGMLEVW